MRELIRGGVVHQAGQAGVSPWSDLPLAGRSEVPPTTSDLPLAGRAEVPPWSGLPLNRILYIPFSIFAYSSNIFITSFARMGSTLPEGTSK